MDRSLRLSIKARYNKPGVSTLEIKDEGREWFHPEYHLVIDGIFVREGLYDDVYLLDIDQRHRKLRIRRGIRKHEKVS
jgi:hypothetical protein